MLELSSGAISRCRQLLPPPRCGSSPFALPCLSPPLHNCWERCGRPFDTPTLPQARSTAAAAGVTVSAEVSAALAAGRPVVALESTIISHGMPYPQNLETAKQVEGVVRAHGAVPATIAVLGGVPHVGLTPAQASTGLGDGCCAVGCTCEAAVGADGYVGSKHCASSAATPLLRPQLQMPPAVCIISAGLPPPPPSLLPSWSAWHGRAPACARCPAGTCPWSAPWAWTEQPRCPPPCCWRHGRASLCLLPAVRLAVHGTCLLAGCGKLACSCGAAPLRSYAADAREWTGLP